MCGPCLVRVWFVSGENGSILIAPISFVNVDNLRYGLQPPLYPGNGADCAIEVSVNGTPRFAGPTPDFVNVAPADEEPQLLHHESGLLYVSKDKIVAAS